MGYWNPEIRGFQPHNNKAGTLFEYTDEQIFEMLAQGNVFTGADGRPVVEPRPQPTAEQKQARYESKVDKLIRSKYTLSQELAILRQQGTKSQEYAEYYAYCEECKETARKEVYGNEI